MEARDTIMPALHTLHRRHQLPVLLLRRTRTYRTTSGILHHQHNTRDHLDNKEPTRVHCRCEHDKRHDKKKEVNHG